MSKRALHQVPEATVVLVGLVLIGQTFFSLMRPGNNFGTDEWAMLYHSLQGKSDFIGRPLGLILLTLVAPSFQANPIAYHFLSTGIWIVNAFCVYLIVRLFTPERPLFAVACGILYLVYFQDDFWIALMFLQTVDNLTSTLVVLVAFTAHFSYMQNENLASPKMQVLLIVSVALAAIGPLVREATIPLLIGLPVLVFFLNHKFDRARWLGVMLFCGTCVMVSIRYMLPFLGMSEPTYTSGMFVDLDPIRMANATLLQFNFFIQPLIHVGRQRVAAIWPILLMEALWVALIGIVSSKHVADEEDSIHLRRILMRFGVWAAVGFAAMWLGFAAYLPSIYAETTWRTHVLAKPGEVILLASLIWLAGDLVSVIATARLGWVIRYLGIIYVAMSGMAMLWYVQGSIDKYGGTWDDTGHFMHSLAQQIPNVEEKTLIVYMQVPDPYETPFTSGWGFQYAMRYFYEDHATGIIPIDHIFGEWEPSDAGITVTEQWIEGEHLYGWDNMIFIARNADTKEVFILDRLPEDYYTLARQQQYDPYARIKQGPIVPRIREAFGSP